MTRRDIIIVAIVCLGTILDAYHDYHATDDTTIEVYYAPDPNLLPLLPPEGI